MSSSSYSLDVISHHPRFTQKHFKKYNIEGIDTIGAWGDEPFEIVFKNHTYNKVQVKISIDGTDILTGGVANTEVSKDMWVVNGYGTLNLKAWPETHNGGAQFVFTNAANGVAVHTHGDMSSRGIIAAAVFVEGQPAPLRVNHYYYPYYPYTWYGIYNIGVGDYDWSGGTWCGSSVSSIFSANSSISYNGNFSKGSSISLNNAAPAQNSSNVNLQSSSTCDTYDVSEQSMESLAAVGAGQYTEQKISYVSGLIKPLFSETLRVRFLWWDELESKLKQFNYPKPHASGFPGDKPHIMSLGTTPRLGNVNIPLSPAPAVDYARF